MTYKEKKNDRRYLNVNINGNLKLRNNDNVRFIIWNLPVEETCPFATEHCKKSCYAKKAERLYPDVKFSRATNFKRSTQSDFAENMIFTIETELNTKKFSGKTCVFRIHESGDFYNVEYTKKWLAIAKHFESDPRIIFLAYTKSIRYFIECGYGLKDFPQNLIIRSSLWDDTALCDIGLTRLHNIPVYTALTQEDIDFHTQHGAPFTECRCEDCATCGHCWNKEHSDIIVKIH